MPKIFRTMQKDGSKPLCGSGSFQLGVTVHPHENPDVTPDSGGFVDPQTGGMSVFASMKKLPGRLLPSRLRYLFPEDFQKASGDDTLTVWCMIRKYFHSPQSVSRLSHDWDDPNKPRHGLIKPVERMLIADLQNELCSTRDQWEVHEVPE